jgi:hypothetical protein
MGPADLSIVWPACTECAIWKGGSIFSCRGNLAATNLLGKTLKGFIVNLADLPRKGVKRPATSGKRVNHGSRWKCTNSAEYLKTIITVALTDMSGPENWWNRCSLDEDIINGDNYDEDYYTCLWSCGLIWPYAQLNANIVLKLDLLKC